MENVSKPLHLTHLRIHDIRIRGYRLNANKTNYFVG